MKIRSIYLSIFLILFLSLTVLNCARTKQQPVKEEQTGFLEDIEGFATDPEGKFNLLYINENIDFSNYNKFYIQTISVFVPVGSTLEEIPPERLQSLVDYGQDKIKETLSANWTLVEEPGPDVFALRIAITQLGVGNRLGDTISTYAPPARAFSELKNLVSGKHAFVGQIAHEAEAVDSLSSERIFATIGVRSGGKTFKDSTNKYRDAQAAIDLWVENANKRLLELRQADMKK